MARWWEALEWWFWRQRMRRRWNANLARLPLMGETQIITMLPEVEAIYDDLLSRSVATHE